MNLTHSFSVPVSVGTAWQALNDLERIAPCFPGAKLDTYDGDDFTGSCKVKLGPISLQYNGSGRFVSRDEEAHRAVIEASGKDNRGNGTATMNVVAKLAPGDEDHTDVTVETDLNVTGKPAQFGRGVMQDVGDKLMGQFATRLSDTLSGATEGTQPAAATQDATDGVPPGAHAVTPADTQAGAAPAREDTAGSVLDLGATAGPVLVKRYAPYVAGALVVLVAVAVIRRRRGNYLQVS